VVTRPRPSEPLWQSGPTRTAEFLERPNRFLVRCRTADLGVVEACLPNPGRMWELLVPGATLYLADAAPAPASVRKTRYTAVAVERDGVPVFLHTHVTNTVARLLLEAGCIPGLHGAEVARTEVTVGRSRFDMLLHDARGDLYVEVKSCTLFGNGVAMFPDAVTDRGRRHVLELAGMARAGTRTAVLFIVHSPTVRWFMPDYHTDPAFAQALLSARDAVQVLPVAVEWGPGLTLGRRVRLLRIPWDYVEREARDRGSYLLLLKLPRHEDLVVGGLGALHFPAGWYVYVGSAMGGLTARLARHRRSSKIAHWHVDYLRARAASCEALPIRSSERLECALAAAVAAALEPGPVGFGCSDCGCPTHLFRSAEHPLRLAAFRAILERFRMRPPH